MIEHSDNLVTLPGLTRAVRLPMYWLRREADIGNIPCLRVGRKRLFSVEAVRRTLAQRAAQSSLSPTGGVAANG